VEESGEDGEMAYRLAECGPEDALAAGFGV
jgi:hypothetical protein